MEESLIEVVKIIQTCGAAELMKIRQAMSDQQEKLRLEAKEKNEQKRLARQMLAEKYEEGNRRLMEELKDIADSAGIDMSYSIGMKRVNRTEKRYMSLKDDTKTWSGRGRKPKWLIDEMAEGHELKEFEVDESIPF